MTADAFQGKTVIEINTKVKATINIPKNYYAEIANNGKGINFRPKNPIGTHKNAGLIRIMEPTSVYPKGYVRFYNKNGQPMKNPSNNTKPGSKNNTHFEFQ